MHQSTTVFSLSLHFTPKRTPRYWADWEVQQTRICCCYVIKEAQKKKQQNTYSHVDEILLMAK